MSSYSFSQHFYQRWTCAPEPIRAAITQELEDITTLLQTETPFESFVFRTHDLDTHIDELYENHEAEQAIAKAIIEKQTQEREAAEQQRLDDEKTQAIEDAKRAEAAKFVEDAKRRETEETVQQESEKNVLPKSVVDKDNFNASAASNEADKTGIDSKATDNTGKTSINNEANNNDAEHKTISDHANTVSTTNIKNDSSVKAINSKASAAISLALKDATSNTNHQELIRELEMQIDDYLSDQMMLMSENLKSWLRAEVSQHLGNQGTSVNNEEDVKKNIH